ncbi:uncharacterized protein HaLaN_17403, partial [Haematococcus lacustris]
MMVPLLVSHMHTHQWWMGLLNAFSGGVFLAAGLMHLIPHCQEAQQAVDLSRWGLPAEYPLYLLLVSLGYLLVLMVERVVFEVKTPVLLGGKDAHLAHPAPTFRPLAGLTLLTGMTVHTALECLALGIITNHASFMALLVAIASHKAISALALSARFVREGASTHQVLAYVGPFCLVPPLSIAFGMWAGQLAPGVHLVLSCFAAGTFLYVGCSE